MPSARAVLVAKAVPPVAAAYHLILVPELVVRSAIVGVGTVQKDWLGSAVGVAGALTETATGTLELSQVPTVCEA